jgi:deoxyhypusine synthase
LSGATPAEAVSWGKVDPDQLPDTVVCYLDGTIGLPLLTAYALAKTPARPPRRLYDRRIEMMAHLHEAYIAAREFRDARVEGSALPDVDAS